MTACFIERGVIAWHVAGTRHTSSVIVHSNSSSISKCNAKLACLLINSSHMHVRSLCLLGVGAHCMHRTSTTFIHFAYTWKRNSVLCPS